MPTLPHEWHPQDWCLVAYALGQFAGNPKECTEQEERAFELIEGIAAEQGVAPSELIRQLE